MIRRNSFSLSSGYRTPDLVGSGELAWGSWFVPDWWKPKVAAFGLSQNQATVPPSSLHCLSDDLDALFEKSFK